MANELQTVGEKVQLIFNFFDDNKDGRITPVELQRVMQILDKRRWTDEACSQLWSGIDVNGDGYVQFTEFWSWICAHGTRSSTPNPLQDALLDMATKHEERRLAESSKRREAIEKKRMQKAKEAEESAKMEAERAAGLRVNRTTFEHQFTELGLHRDSVRNLFQKADDDGNGELDAEELGMMAANRVATVGQIKGLVAGNVQSGKIKDPNVFMQLIEAFSKWDADGGGTISSDELAHVIRKLNPELTDRTVAKMIQEADEDNSGYVDILEFVSWLCGKPKKKKEQQEQEAEVLAALHLSRYQEAFAIGKGREFEEMQGARLERWCKQSGVPLRCNTTNKLNLSCRACNSRHGWFCHGCGFVTFSKECQRGCRTGEHAWTCIVGTCSGKKCGCKKKPEVWRRIGFAMGTEQISGSVIKQLQDFQDGSC